MARHPDALVDAIRTPADADMTQALLPPAMPALAGAAAEGAHRHPELEDRIAALEEQMMSKRGKKKTPEAPMASAEAV